MLKEFRPEIQFELPSGVGLMKSQYIDREAAYLLAISTLIDLEILEFLEVVSARLITTVAAGKTAKATGTGWVTSTPISIVSPKLSSKESAEMETVNATMTCTSKSLYRSSLYEPMQDACSVEGKRDVK
nr:hypothetical protein [Tanacetum cinerariifolium]GEZ50538.1 hypothetical protein [Tanacetum cinerariifolium]